MSSSMFILSYYFLREISLLIRSDGHSNVVRYFTKEQKSDFVYLGLQLCDMTLK
jgi:hypothetical protein